jgi:hypothetical protein
MGKEERTTRNEESDIGRGMEGMIIRAGWKGMRKGMDEIYKELGGNEKQGGCGGNTPLCSLLSLLSYRQQMSIHRTALVCTAGRKHRHAWTLALQHNGER